MLKLAYIILAHDRPEQVVEFARTLTHNAADARTYIHFDAKAPRALVDRLHRALEAEPRAHMVEPRVVTGWGTFGLVSSVVNAIGQIARSDFEPDYVVLLSGADLPVRPIAQLERFLDERRGQEFIEVYDSRWIVGGLRESRYRLFFLVNMRKHPVLHRLLERAQRLFRVRRKFPSGLTARFGSQWWALSWDTCRLIHDYLRKYPSVYRFFRTVWIPDEIMFQTLVHRLVPTERIAGHSLTHYQFSEKGKPVVYHDDHTDYVLTLERFFVRKCNPDAGRLRARCLAEAARPDDGAEPDPARSRRDDYMVTVAAQTDYAQPGHLFYRDQYVDQQAQMARKLKGPLVIITGPGAVTDRLANNLDGDTFEVVGNLFAPDAVDFHGGAQTWRGLHRDETAIRDMHPVLYLHRALQRCEDKVPVLVWSWRSEGELLATLAENPAVTLVSAVPEAPAPESAEALCYASDLPREEIDRLAHYKPAALGAATLRRARLDTLGARTGFAAMRQTLRIGPGSAFGPILVRWTFNSAGADAYPRGEAQARAFDASVASAAGRERPWFDRLAEQLRATAAEYLWSAGAAALFNPEDTQRIRASAAALDPFACVEADSSGAVGPHHRVDTNAKIAS
jgi:hypothetical protein